MAKLQLSLAVCDYDRTRALFDGRVRVEGCEINPVPLVPEEAFHRAYKYQEFDVTELSLSSHALTVARGTSPYVGIPAFLSRVFRHSGIYIRDDRGIASPADLAGRVVGVPEYQMTANLWIRGMLRDEYGVHAEQISWRSTGLEEPGREERAPLTLPPEIELRKVPDRSLSQMLEAGEIDAVFSARAPSCFERGAAHVTRLFPDYRAAEEAYFAHTRIFPIMHLVGLRSSLAEQHPWLAASLFKAFQAARAIAMEDLAQIGHLHTSLPWMVAEYERTRALMGPDFWSYGLSENRHVLEAVTRYSFEQHLAPRKLAPEELFATSTHETTKM